MHKKEALFVCTDLRSYQEPKNGVFPENEQDLTHFFQEQQAAHVAVNIKLLQAKARLERHSADGLQGK